MRFNGLDLNLLVALDALLTERSLTKAARGLNLSAVGKLPLGQYFQATAYRRGITGVLKGLPLFWNVQRSG